MKSLQNRIMDFTRKYDYYEKKEFKEQVLKISIHGQENM